MANKNSMADLTILDVNPEAFNEVYRPFWDKVFAYMCLFGGSGSGKSHFVAHMLAIQLTFFPKRNLYCLRRQATDCMDSCYNDINLALEETGLDIVWNITESPPRMRNRINKNEMKFGGVDKISNIKSIKFPNGDVTDIWYEEVDEEDREEVFKEIDRRLRSQKYKCRRIYTWNPTFKEHILRKFLYDIWAKRDCLILKTTYKDNINHLPLDYIQMLEDFKNTSPYDYMVYTLGEWGSTGESIFNREAIAKQLMELEDRYEQHPHLAGEFGYDTIDNLGRPDPASISFSDSGEMDLCIYEDVIAGHPYIVSLDTAGETQKDKHAAVVRDNYTNKIVASLYSNQDSFWCCVQTYCLCVHYNMALFIPEINYGGIYYTAKFKDWEYDNIYQRTTSAENLTEDPQALLGFRTHVGNRTPMLLTLLEWCKSHATDILDPRLLQEMLSFVKQKKKVRNMWMGAESGAHDDLVMSLAINLQATQQQDNYVTGELTSTITRDWEEWELEDAVREGIVTQYDADEYAETHFEKGHVAGALARKVRRSRYAG